MKYRLAVLALAWSCLPCAAFDGAQIRLSRAQDASAAAAGAASPEQSSALSLRALEDGPLSGMTPVDARGAGRGGSGIPDITFSRAKVKAASVPAPEIAAARSASDDHAGLFILSGLAAPAVGAIAGALVGGGPGAIAGALIGLCAGLVLFGIGVCRALRHVFNP